MTLVALLALTTQAWATDETPLVTIENKDYKSFKSGSMTFDDKVTVTFSNSVDNDGDEDGWYSTGTASLLTVAGINGYTITSCKFYTDDGPAKTGYTIKGESPSVYISVMQVYTDDSKSVKIGSAGVTKIEVFGAAASSTAEAPITVAWNASTKTGNFEMPGSDVVLTPIYAKAAAFATTGTEPEATTLLPEAAEGVIAGTGASLIAEGTGIVAFAGTSTEVTQGTLMYAIGTSATQAPALTAFSATAPTAENIADDGADVYVWYYIQGADAPEGVAATLDNTFDNTEPACLTVTVLTNKFDITFNAANANTIEAGKATVTVGGTAATVTEGKLEGVKMGSEVKIEAKSGYKFRKVEVKENPVAEGHALTSAKFGEIVCSDGKAYAAADKDNLPKGVKAEALVCYADGEHGLALAMVDVKDEKMSWDNDRGANDGKTAAEWCTGWNTSHPITGATWLLASKTQWDNMISAAGSASNLSNAFSAVGGTNLQAYSYWSSTPNHGGSAAWFYYFPTSSWQWTYLNQDETGRYIRACLEW